jgi:hypothetical protein
MVYGTRFAPAQDASASSYPKFEAFAGYSAIETNDHRFKFSAIGQITEDFDEKGRGFETTVVRNLSRYIGIMGDFSVHTSANSFQSPVTACSQSGCTTATQNWQIDPWLVQFLAGPEVKLRNRSRITPFVHALLGVAHSSATVNSTGTAANFSLTDAETGFAMAFGGGFDMRIVRHAGFRGLLTYSQAYVGSDAVARQRVNGLGWSVGVLIH